jgi:hypothetical protein
VSGVYRNIAVIVVSVTSTGGLSAFVVKKLHPKTSWENLTTKAKGGENENREEANESRSRVGS